jgi:hypothetical protein
MQDYTGILYQCVEEVLEYVTAKAEYNVYMDVLRQFYRAQPCRCQRAVVYESMGGYVICADGQNIRVEQRTAQRGMYTPEEELMHLLLQLAPARIDVNLVRDSRQTAIANALLMVFGQVVNINEHG